MGAETVVSLRHVEILLDPDKSRLDQIEMPAFLGAWVRATGSKRARPGPVPRRASWRFELSEAGIAWAAEWRRLSDAANESMRTYLEGEHANCFPGAFRDGFARGAAWARQEMQGVQAEPSDPHEHTAASRISFHCEMAGNSADEDFALGELLGMSTAELQELSQSDLDDVIRPVFDDWQGTQVSGGWEIE
jgi:hypothetical protein